MYPLFGGRKSRTSWSSALNVDDEVNQEESERVPRSEAEALSTTRPRRACGGWFEEVIFGIVGAFASMRAIGFDIRGALLTIRWTGRWPRSRQGDRRLTDA